MGISGTFGRKNISKLEIEIKPLEYIFSNRETLFKIYIKNNKRFPSYLLKLEVKNQKLLIPVVKKREETLTKLTFSKRGIVKKLDIKLSSPFPFRFFYYIKKVKLPTNITVFPEPKPCRYLSNKIAEKGDLEKILPNKGREELSKLRKYVIGDEIKNIHWKLSAKRNSLIVKEFEEETATQPVIINFEKLKGNTEKKLSCATFLILQYFKRKIPVGLKIGSRFFKPSLSKQKQYEMLKTLALYGEKNEKS